MAERHMRFSSQIRSSAGVKKATLFSVKRDIPFDMRLIKIFTKNTPTSSINALIFYACQHFHTYSGQDLYVLNPYMHLISLSFLHWRLLSDNMPGMIINLTFKGPCLP
jgi:hypothetical protein